MSKKISSEEMKVELRLTFNKLTIHKSCKNLQIMWEQKWKLRCQRKLKRINSSNHEFNESEIESHQIFELGVLQDYF